MYKYCPIIFCCILLALHTYWDTWKKHQRTYVLICIVDRGKCCIKTFIAAHSKSTILDTGRRLLVRRANRIGNTYIPVLYLLGIWYIIDRLTGHVLIILILITNIILKLWSNLQLCTYIYTYEYHFLLTVEYHWNFM